MPIKTLEGNLMAKDLKVGIVVGRFNEFISSKLLSGAIDAFVRHGETRLTSKRPGCRERLKFPWLHRKWPNPKV